MTLYYFFSPSCGPCKTIGPEIDKLPKQPGLKVCKVDITNNMLSRTEMQEFTVMSVPYFAIRDARGIVVAQWAYNGNSHLHKMLARYFKGRT